MDWSAFHGLLRCEPGNPLQTVLAIIGTAAGLVTIIAGGYRLWRWWYGPPARQRRAARALRTQGHYHARLNHRQQAMELYELSIRLNPRQAHVYYLRGCLYAVLRQRAKAVADWNRCLARLPRHRDATQKLADLGERVQLGLPPWAYVCGAGAVLLLVALVGWWAR